MRPFDHCRAIWLHPRRPSPGRSLRRPARRLVAAQADDAARASGKYEVVEALGESANAEVFGAFDPDVNRVVAVKTIRKDLAQLDGRAARALARWRNESRLAGRLSHPGIVGVYDYGESGSVAYLAVEFVQGHRLSDYLERGIRIAEADAVSIVAQVLDALRHAHEQGVRHGAVSRRASSSRGQRGRSPISAARRRERRQPGA
jgi:serine/threonine protein kinase